jgi:hypothetical protein
MSHYRNIVGVKWYYCLIPKENTKALFSDYPRNTLLNKFLVCWDFYDTVHQKNGKIYAVFESYLDFAKYFLKIPDSLRCFYELILGENMQKPHFDLDMELSPEELESKKDEMVLNDLLNAIVSLLAEKEVILNLEKDVCIYSSHGEKKRSYHVIINFHCHSNNKEAKAFYYLIMEKLPKEYFEKKWVDLAVYSKTQQFRTYLSRKYGSNRIKQLNSTWKYNDRIITHVQEEIPDDDNHAFLLNLEESLVTARRANCKLLPSFEIPNEFNKTFEKGENVEYDLAMEALTLLAHKAGTVPDDKLFPYRLESITGPFVILKRVRPSKCKLCNRIHHKQHPYLLIVPETKAVYFHCRRAPPDKKLYVGSLKGEDEEIDNEAIPEVKPVGITWTEQKLLQMKGYASTSLKRSPEMKEKKDIKEKKDKMEYDKEVAEAIMSDMIKKSK